ncbi:MAG: hypothetical protein OXI11_09000 [Gammaproteobacteria bacterium]|nr:hypothetical protein [Gammaproteobacteria bacterium]
MTKSFLRDRHEAGSANEAGRANQVGCIENARRVPDPDGCAENAEGRGYEATDAQHAARRTGGTTRCTNFSPRSGGFATGHAHFATGYAHFTSGYAHFTACCPCAATGRAGATPGAAARAGSAKEDSRPETGKIRRRLRPFDLPHGRGT